jgi:hypothetical protein
MGHDGRILMVFYADSMKFNTDRRDWMWTKNDLKLLTLFMVRGCTLAQAVICLLPTSGAMVQPEGCPYGICGKWHWGRYLSQYFGFPMSVMILSLLDSLVYHQALIQCTNLRPQNRGAQVSPLLKNKKKHNHTVMELSHIFACVVALDLLHGFVLTYASD